MTSIILNSREVKGVLYGSITLLVRPIPNKILNIIVNGDLDTMSWQDQYGDSRDISELSPFGSVGTRLWVKETWMKAFPGNMILSVPRYMKKAIYKADKDSDRWGKYYKWRSSVTMPQQFSRLTIETKSVRVVRVQEIDEEDAFNLGCSGPYPVWNGFGEVGEAGPLSTIHDFKEMWNSTYGKKYPYETNPYVFFGEIGRVV